MLRTLLLATALGGALAAQNRPDTVIVLPREGQPAMAAADFPGWGDSQKYTATFNETVWQDLEESGFFRVAPKTLYPKSVPQQDADLFSSAAAMKQWSSPPVSADYLAFGHAESQLGLFVIRGWLADLGRGASVFGGRYFGPADETGARKTAHEFAADILRQFGIQPLFGSSIYFRSKRTGHTEIWSMAPDGSGQKQITWLGNILLSPAPSPDGSRIAFTSYADRVGENPKVFLFSVDPARRLPFRSHDKSYTPSFTADGKILFSTHPRSARDCCQMFAANVDGSGPQPIAGPGANDIEPKANPKNPQEVVFVSGRAGLAQIYRLTSGGGDPERLTFGEGQATNPAWSPDGKFIAFAWTSGFAPGRFNVFLMEVAKQTYTQLTRGAGTNEHPSWAPDGAHIVFDSDRTGSSQIFTMLADGTHVRQLTGTRQGEGANDMPVWGK